MNSTSLVANSKKNKNVYNIIGFTIDDDGLTYAREYVDAINLARMIGCYRREHEPMIRKIITRLVGGINIDDYTRIFGFDMIVYDCATSSSTVGYASYKPHNWDKRRLEKTMIPTLKRFVRRLGQYYDTTEFDEFAKYTYNLRDE